MTKDASYVNDTILDNQNVDVLDRIKWLKNNAFFAPPEVAAAGDHCIERLCRFVAPHVCRPAAAVDHVTAASLHGLAHLWVAGGVAIMPADDVAALRARVEAERRRVTALREADGDSSESESSESDGDGVGPDSVALLRARVEEERRRVAALREEDSSESESSESDGDGARESDPPETESDCLDYIILYYVDRRCRPFAHNSTQGAMYIAVTNQTNGKAAIDEFMVVTDGTDAYNLRYGINTDSATSDLVNWTTAVEGSNAKVRASLADTRAQGTINAWQVHLDRAAGNPSNISTLDTFNKTTHRGAFYTVSISDSNAGTLGNYELVDVRVTHNGTTPFISVFGRTNSASDDLVTFSADIDGDNVRLRGQISTSNTHVVTSVRRLIDV